MRYRDSESGSVFIVALMVLVMLTVIGLSLALVTETEMLIGGNEQVINETFFVAETGMNVAISQLMVANNLDSKCLATIAKEELDATRKLGLRTLGYSVDFTTLYPVAFDVAPYTRANEGRDDKLYAGFFRGEGRAIRGTWDETASRPVPREQGEDLATLIADEDFIVQSQKNIELAFFSAPLQALEAGTLVGAFDHPETFGCEPHPDHNELTAPPPP